MLDLSWEQARAFSSEVEPVRVEKTRQIKNLEPRFDSSKRKWLQGCGDASGHQLRLNPALRLLFVVPSAVSPIEPDMLTPSNSFCSAPILPSHLSSAEDSVWPAIRLVPVSAMLSLAERSTS